MDFAELIESPEWKVRKLEFLEEIIKEELSGNPEPEDGSLNGREKIREALKFLRINVRNRLAAHKLILLEKGEK